MRKHGTSLEFWNRKTSLKDSGCIEWTGYIDKTSGYGTEPSCYWFKKLKVSRAHQFSYIYWIGPYDRSIWCVLHRCHNTKCVNPAHLYLGTPKDNSRDMFFNKDNSRLNRDDILNIFDDVEAEGIQCMDKLALEYNCSIGTIKSILTKRSYSIHSKHILGFSTKDIKEYGYNKKNKKLLDRIKKYFE